MQLRPGLALGILIGTLGVARAQPAVTTPATDPKNPWLALGLAVGTPAVGVYLMAVGLESDALKDRAMLWVGTLTLMVGPAAGHLYAGEYRRAAISSSVRTAGVAVLAWGSTMVDLCVTWCEHGNDPRPEYPHEDLGGALMLVGLATFVATTAYDIYDAPSAADRASDAPAIAPIAIRTVDGGTGVGLAITGSL